MKLETVKIIFVKSASASKIIVALFWVLTMTCPGIAYAQSELSRVGAYISKATTFSTDLEYVYYPTYTSKIPAEKMQGKYARKQNNSYVKMGATESITTDYYNFLIDHDEKTIDILPRLKTGDLSKPIGVINFDTLINIKNEINYRDGNADTRICEVVSDYMEYEKVELYYNKNTFELYKIILYYPLQFKEEIVSDGEMFDVRQKPDTAPRIEILYKNTKRNEELPEELFSYDKYIIQRGKDSYYCKPEYKNYILN